MCYVPIVKNRLGGPLLTKLVGSLIRYTSHISAQPESTRIPCWRPGPNYAAILTCHLLLGVRLGSQKAHMQKAPGGRTAKLVELRCQEFHKTICVRYDSVGSSLTGPACAWDIGPLLGCSATATGSILCDDDVCIIGVKTRAPRALQAA